MAWNKPNTGEGVRPAQSKAKGTPRFAHGLLAAIIVIGGALAAWFFFFQSPEADPKAKKTSQKGMIKEVQPAPAPKAEEPAPKPEKKKPRFWEVDASQTNGFTDAMQLKWRHAHRPPPAYTNNSSLSMEMPKCWIFNHPSENEIATLLTLEPGTTLVGTPVYNKKFIQDFMKSCEEPIIVTDKDSPEEAELKRQMIQTKIELRQRMSEGEDLGQILLETHEEYQRLAEYKETLMHEVKNLYATDSELTEQDVDDYIEAANKMLDAKGISPMKLSPVSKRMIMLRSRKDKLSQQNTNKETNE